MKKRSCTDIICLGIFGAYVGGLVYLFIYGASYGNVYRILYGYDVTGDVCGKTNAAIKGVSNSGKDLTSTPYLYIDVAKTVQIEGGSLLQQAQKLAPSGVQLADHAVGSNKIPFCLGVKGDSAAAGTTVAPAKNASSSSDPEDKVEEALTKALLKSDPVSNALTGGGSCRYCVSRCPDGYQVFLWRCLPDKASKFAAGLFQNTGAQSMVEDVVSDAKTAWREIVYMCLVAMGLSVVMMILLRFFAGVIVYIILAFVTVAAITSSTLLWYIWYSKKTSFDESEKNVLEGSAVGDADEKLKGILGNGVTTAASQKEVTYTLVAAIGDTIFTVVLLLILLVLRTRIKLVVQLFKESGRAVAAMPLIMLQPLVTFATLAVIVLVWSFGLLWLESSGNPVQSSKTKFVTYEKTWVLLGIEAYHVFGLFWLTQFVVACQHMMIAGAVAGWYFRRVKEGLNLLVCQSLWRLVRYHLGSVAFGSFLVALVKFVRLILTYVENKLKKCGGDNAAVRAIIKCCQCCMYCFEKCLKFITRNAYVVVAIHGCNFCRAGQKAFTLLTSNALRVVAINCVGSFVLFLAKAAVVASTVAIGMEIMVASDAGPIKYVWVPVGLAAIFAFFTIKCFVGVFEMTIDTIFICFCEDCEINDGIIKPYFMSRGLMEYVKNSSKVLAALKNKTAKNKVQPDLYGQNQGGGRGGKKEN